ncbi:MULTISPECIES: flavin reductase family protein [unclassified Roseitalea]|uniref:flavin reductase family protein n=1 Tax=unclassified Roseitalea TaxID=2639107 RepID=UPI00273F2473|nr:MULTISPECIES: flavin reductase family protein [unclassified Roseitalea]
MNADAHLNLDAIRMAELKRAMGGFATGVTIVATSHGGADYGMTCNSFNTVSLDPPLVLWSVRKQSASRAAFTGSSGYTVSVLGSHQQALAERFTHGAPTERFDGVGTTRLPTGRVRLDDAVSWFDCTLEQVVGAGDHDVLIGRVIAFAAGAGEPLVYVHGGFTAPLRAASREVATASGRPVRR